MRDLMDFVRAVNIVTDEEAFLAKVQRADAIDARLEKLVEKDVALDKLQDLTDQANEQLKAAKQTKVDADKYYRDKMAQADKDARTHRDELEAEYQLKVGQLQSARTVFEDAKKLQAMTAEKELVLQQKQDELDQRRAAIELEETNLASRIAKFNDLLKG